MLNKIGYILYLIFIVSWFLHFTSRIHILGTIRFDLILIIILLLLTVASKEEIEYAFKKHKSTVYIILLILYVFMTIPFVEWPGSVLNNILEWFKAVIFFFFTVSFISTEKRLKTFMYVFMLVQIIRVLEPLYMNITQGYWGSYASMRDWEYMNRLAGAPHDYVNPNGLAFVILMIIPYLYNFKELTISYFMMFIILSPALIYALMLTGSRSGLIGLVVVLIGILWQSKRRAIVAAFMIIGVIMIIYIMPDGMIDRYTSIFDSSSRHAATADGRLYGIREDIELSLRRPIFGHGLGTSLEANANYTGRYNLSHNLYAEIAIELGLLGLAIYILYLKSIHSNIINLKVKHSNIVNQRKTYIGSFYRATVILFFMNMIFSMMSYGLSGCEWYLLGGLTIVLFRICEKKELEDHVIVKSI